MNKICNRYKVRANMVSTSDSDKYPEEAYSQSNHK